VSAPVLTTTAAERDRARTSVPVVAVTSAIVLAIPATLLVGSQSGVVLLVGAAAAALGLCALISPVFAVAVFLVTLFCRLPIKSVAAGLPIEAFWPVFGALVCAVVLWTTRTPDRLRGIGAVEWAMAAYLMWNYYSMLAPHQYPAGSALTAEPFAVHRFIFVGTLIPFALYAIGRCVSDRATAVRALLWTVLVLASYSAVVSIMPFAGLADQVWPRYIVTEVRPSWVGRAVGIFNQPVANGMVLVLGIAIAMVLANRRGDPAWQRCLAMAVATASGIGLYLTHTRAVWLAGVVVLVMGAILAKGQRRAFVVVLLLVGLLVVVNWSSFTSADRTAGGVGSDVEVQSRLNDMQTALWAFTQKPIDGWGIGRFQSVNSYHHQQWSADVPWAAGWGEASHENELAILAELGVIGLGAWVCALALITRRLWSAYRTLPDEQLCGRPIVVIAMMAIAVLLCAGFTVDLRYFDFPTAVIFLLAGVAVGWADRCERAPAGADDDGVARLQPCQVSR
jgi:O-antigen ligase